MITLEATTTEIPEDDERRTSRHECLSELEPQVNVKKCPSLRHDLIESAVDCDGGRDQAEMSLGTCHHTKPRTILNILHFM
jgi:hypothetical protein